MVVFIIGGDQIFLLRSVDVVRGFDSRSKGGTHFRSGFVHLVNFMLNLFQPI